MYALLFINYGIYLFIFIFIGIFICNGNMHSNRPIVVREYIWFHLIVFNYIINPVFGLLFISCGKMVGDLFARKIAKPVRLYKVLGIVVHIQRELFHRSEVNKKLSFHTWPRVLPQHQCHWWYSLAAWSLPHVYIAVGLVPRPINSMCNHFSQDPSARWFSLWFGIYCRN